MRSSLSAWNRLFTVLVTLTSLAGCEETDVPVILESTSQGEPPRYNQGRTRKNHCFKEALYLVEGDSFTFMSGGWQTIDADGSGYSSGSTGWNPEIEVRAKCWSILNGTKGGAKLLWNDQVVDEFVINKSFLMSDHVEILSYEDADGTRVEFHVYAQPECGGLPAEVSTREQIEVLER